MHEASKRAELQPARASVREASPDDPAYVSYTWQLGKDLSSSNCLHIGALICLRVCIYMHVDIGASIHIGRSIADWIN